MKIFLGEKSLDYKEVKAEETDVLNIPNPSGTTSDVIKCTATSLSLRSSLLYYSDEK